MHYDHLNQEEVTALQQAGFNDEEIRRVNGAIEIALNDDCSGFKNSLWDILSYQFGEYKASCAFGVLGLVPEF